MLDPKRSQAIGIFISSLHLSVSDIETALLSFDGSLLSVDTLQSLFEQVRCQEIDNFPFAAEHAIFLCTVLVHVATGAG